MKIPITQKIRNLSIKQKLSLLIIGISGFTLLLASGLQLLYGMHYSKRALLNGLTITAKVLGDQSIAALEFMDSATANDNLASLKLNKSLRIACLYDGNGELFAHHYNYGKAKQNSMEKCSDNAPQASAVHDDRVSVLHAITRGEQKIGSIYLQSDLRDVDQFVAQYIIYVSVLLVIAVAVSYLLSMRLQHVITAPVFNLVNTFKRLSKSDDYTLRARKYSDDELGVLVDAFNSMLVQIQRRDEQLQQINDELESKVEKRTEELQLANDHLQNSLVKLRDAQSQLVQSEKMAALGELVAGVAHEINTPVGVGVTAASHLELKAQQYADRYSSGTLTRNDFEDFMKIVSQSSGLVLMNLQRAAELIRSFKQVAVDQSSDEQRSFKLKQYIEEILRSLHPRLKKTCHSIVVEGSENLELYTHPGAVSQVITNLVMNSIIHGFDGIEQGEIIIRFDINDDQVHLQYTDNGNGIPPEHLPKIFDPFFTTRRGKGGSGLGMHIVYNLIAQKLGGGVECHSTLGKGVTFSISIPSNRQLKSA